MNTKHGVISETQVIWLDGGNWAFASATPCSLNELLELAEEQRFSHLWVLPSAGIVATDGWAHEDMGAWDAKITWNYGEDALLADGMERLVKSVSAHRLPHGPGYNILFPQNSYNAWHWLTPDISARALLDMVQRLEAATGIAIATSPATAGKNLLFKMNGFHGPWIASPTVDGWMDIPWQHAASNIGWGRAATDEELSKGFLVKIDRTMHHTSVARYALFGAGDPVHVFYDAQRDNPKSPGIWRVSINDGPYRQDIPPIWKGGEWIASGIVRMLRQEGYDITVHEGFYWPAKQYHELMKEWAGFLFDLKEKFPELAISIKQMANDGIGLLRHIRPDWYCELIGKSRETILRNILAFERQGHGTPILVGTDALIYATDNPDMFPDDHALGGYKHVWTIPMTDEVKAVLSDIRGGAGRRIHLLNEIDRLGRAEYEL